MLKELIYLFFPINLCLFFLVIGLLLLLLTDKQRMAKILVTLGVVLLLLFSTRFVSTLLLHHLEYQYPPFEESRSSTGFGYIVVLGGLSFQTDGLPITSQFNAPMLTRLVHGIRLHRLMPESHLILSGGGTQPKSEGMLMEELAISLGVSPDAIIREDKSSSTYDEALFLKDRLGRDPFILVTSARHTPRSVALFRKMGLNPVPAPTNHLIRAESRYFFNDFIPHVDYLLFSSAAFYEYLGLVKETITGRI